MGARSFAFLGWTTTATRRPRRLHHRLRLQVKAPVSARSALDDDSYRSRDVVGNYAAAQPGVARHALMRDGKTQRCELVASPVVVSAHRATLSEPLPARGSLVYVGLVTNGQLAVANYSNTTQAW